jgi:hypothetical protein
MDPEQQKRFARAVEEKKADALARSQQQTQPRSDADSNDLPEEQASRIDTAHTQDEYSVRDKNTRHKQVTADKWNQ